MTYGDLVVAFETFASYCGASPLNDSVLFTAGGYYLIGGALGWAYISILRMDEVSLAFTFRNYLEPEGLRVLLRYWWFAFLFGLFIFTCGAEHTAHWMYEQNMVSPYVVNLLGVFEAAVTDVTAVAVLYILLRPLIGRLWQRS